MTVTTGGLIPNQSSRANYEYNVATLTAQAAGSGNTPDYENLYGQSLHLFINVTAVTGSITVSIDEKDPASGLYRSILASAAISSTGLTRLSVNPGGTVTANVSANDFLPRTWRVSWTIATGPATATIGASIGGGGAIG